MWLFKGSRAAIWGISPRHREPEVPHHLLTGSGIALHMHLRCKNLLVALAQMWTVSGKSYKDMDPLREDQARPVAELFGA